MSSMIDAEADSSKKSSVGRMVQPNSDSSICSETSLNHE